MWQTYCMQREDICSLISSLTGSNATIITATTIQLFGDVIGSSTANHVAFVCGVPACNLVNTYSFVLSATSCDVQNTLVERDSTGSFSATTITLTGNSLINYSALGACDTDTPYAWAPENANTIIGVNTINTGSLNTALGFASLQHNTIGLVNTALGASALQYNTTGISNTAVGSFALRYNTTGLANNALGNQALLNNTTGSSNIAIGESAGSAVTTASNVIVIGDLVGANISNTTFIKGIRGATTINNDAINVLIDSAGQLGTISSSLRYKENVADMGDVTDDIYKLRPVTFNYKTDQSKHTQYGLIAEEVENVYPDIVVKNKDGSPETVQYQYLPLMMLNEMQKLQERITELEKQMKELVK